MNRHRYRSVRRALTHFFFLGPQPRWVHLAHKLGDELARLETAPAPALAVPALAVPGGGAAHDPAPLWVHGEVVVAPLLDRLKARTRK